MLLREYQDVIEIDGQIVNLQHQLMDLYRKRAVVVGGDAAVQIQNTPAPKTTKSAWVAEQYEYLTQSWAVYGIRIPSFNSLKTKLAKAEKLITELSVADPRLAGYLQVILVPPTRMLAPDNVRSMRHQQRFIKQDDFMSQEVPKLASVGTWSLLIVYTATSGLELGTAQTIIKNKSYKIAGRDMRGLGIHEYVALTLQLQKPLDATGWSLLLKGSNKKQIPSASFINGQYRFDTDDASGLVEQDRFRPAIEVKVGK